MNFQGNYQHKKDVIHVCKRIYDRGYVASNDGNVSVRLDENRILITPTGRSKGFLQERDLATIDMEGSLLEGASNASSERLMHLGIYKARPDVNAVVHAHPVTATGFAVAGLALSRCVLPEIVLVIGQVPLAPYALPSTPELPQSLLPYIQGHDAFLLQNHGVVTCGKDVVEAYHKMEAVEHFAQISLVARQLGQEGVLTARRVDELVGLRDKFHLENRNPLEGRPASEVEGCTCGSGAPGRDANVHYIPEKSTSGIDRDELIRIITRQVIQTLKDRSSA